MNIDSYDRQPETTLLTDAIRLSNYKARKENVQITSKDKFVFERRTRSAALPTVLVCYFINQSNRRSIDREILVL